MKLSTSTANIPIGQKISELFAIFVMKFRGIRHPDMSWPFREVEEYDALLQRHSGVPLQRAKVFEIGSGNRPIRLITLFSMGVDVAGVDLEVPCLRGSPREFFQMYRRNGLERSLKSLIRFWLFDVNERRYLANELRIRGFRLALGDGRFIVGDAAAVDLPSESYDLIFSEDVFEHIPEPSIEILVSKMAEWLKPNGLALIQPAIFTGISGGHLTEWFPHRVGSSVRRRSEPWEHLRKKRYRPNTYLNELARVDYRRLFASHFEIIAEEVEYPNLGRQFLTPDLRRELMGYSEDELFSNRVRFVLKKKT